MRKRVRGVDSIIERQVESAVQEMLDDRAVRAMKGISRVAARQGGESTLHNYRLLGKRALIVVGAGHMLYLISWNEIIREID